MGWFNDVKSPKLKNVKKGTHGVVTAGLWKKCVSCGEILQSEKLEKNNQVCPYCNYHYRLTSSERIELLADKNSFREFAKDLETGNPLNFQDKQSYDERLQKAYTTSGKKDGTVVGFAKIDGQDVILVVMDFRFMGGSMGVVTGEKIALGMDEAYNRKIPVVVVSCSGGARMQEGILSLMQMAKTSASRNRLKKAKIPFISILTDPTTGGCAASFSIQGDVNLSEPNALIGFAGPRVIEQSIRQTLPEGFQKAEFLLEHGFIDAIVSRDKMRSQVAFFMKMFSN